VKAIENSIKAKLPKICLEKHKKGWDIIDIRRGKVYSIVNNR
jgi:hypothetical protein